MTQELYLDLIELKLMVDLCCSLALLNPNCGSVPKVSVQSLCRSFVIAIVFYLL